jgi:flagellar motility protein MotE (MotC chaperone)
MKKVMVLGGIALVLFGVSAAVSWFLSPKLQHGPEEEPAVGRRIDNTGSGSAKQPSAVGTNEELTKSVARPPYTPGTDEAVTLASNLRERLAAVREKEDRLLSRQKNLEIVYQDIRGERGNLDQLRKQVAAELRAVDEKMSAVERRFAEAEQKRVDNEQRVTETQKNLIAIESNEQTNFKRMAEMYDAMEPESAAQIMLQLSNSGKMDTAVKVLSQMRPRQAAAILAAIATLEPKASPTDPKASIGESKAGLAAQLVEKLRLFKRPTKPTGPGSTENLPGTSSPATAPAPSGQS